MWGCVCRAIWVPPKPAPSFQTTELGWASSRTCQGSPPQTEWEGRRGAYWGAEALPRLSVCTPRMRDGIIQNDLLSQMGLLCPLSSQG